MKTFKNLLVEKLAVFFLLKVKLLKVKAFQVSGSSKFLVLVESLKFIKFFKETLKNYPLVCCRKQLNLFFGEV